jgi:hypothetical protein
MATISTGTVTHVLDQSLGLQTLNTADTGDDVALSTDLHQLPDPFENFLEAIPGLSTDQLNFAANVGAAQETANANTFFVNVTAGSGETINDLFFSQANGQLFDGQVAKYNTVDIHVVGSTDPIFLYSFASGDILIGSTEAPAGVDISDPATLDRSKIVFAYYLQENGTHTGADVWGVTFQPLDHPLAGDTVAAHDDPIDFGDFLHVTASASLSFNFDTLKSGKFLWVAVGNNDNGLLVTGKDLNVVDDATPNANKEGERVSGGSDPSDAMNTSQAGPGATMGVNEQMFKPGSTAVFTLVTGFAPLDADGPDATGDKVQDINYGGYINTDGAGLFIAQTSGGGTINLTLDVFEAGTDLNGNGTIPEESFAYIGAEGGNDGTSGAFTDDTEVGVDTVTVKNASGVVIGTWVDGQLSDGTTQNGVKVTIVDNSIDVEGIFAGYTVNWTADSGQTFNRFHVTADAGSEFFDIGRIDVDKGATVTENVGDAVFIHDDGPSIGPIANSIVDFSVGATSGSVPLAGAPGTDDDSTYTITDFTEQFVVNGVTVNGVLSADKGTVEYFGDDDSTPGPSAGDTKYYTLDLGTTDPGDYTFTVNFAPPAPPLEFNFDELPSGANLFGVVGTSDEDPAIIVIGEDPDLKSGSHKYSNISDTIHTSQGGTGATIGVNNQLFDNAGEGAYFTYVNDPVQNFLSGVPGGLTATEADDADNIQYTGGTNEVGGAFFAISQMQGNDLADVKITANDIADAPQGVTFTESLGTGTTRNITAVRVFDETGTKIEDTDDLLNFKDPNVNVDLAGLTAIVTGLDSNYKVEWDTDGLHDQVLIENVGGQFDIGKFGISQPQETPDQKLDFTVQIADGDADTDTANFSIGIDGNHDGTVAGVLIV